MKAFFLLFLTILSTAVMPETARAYPSSPSTQQSSEGAANIVSNHPRDAEHSAPARAGIRQKDGKPLDEQRDEHQVSGPNHPRNPATIPKGRPNEANSWKHLASGNTTNPQRLGPAKSVGAAESGSIRNETGNHVRPARRPSVIRPAAPSRRDVRHRGANPAVIGGPRNSGRGNNGAINGTANRWQ